ncbi:MAG TPA: MFS transporter [Candidatus Limnocylindrales bacterium]
MAPLAKARVATSVAFLLFGTALGAWTARIPAIKRNLDLTDGQLSIALLAFAAGAITGMQVAGRLADRRGSASVLVPAAIVEGLGLVSTAYAPSLLILSLSLFIFGGTHGALNIAMNTNGVEVQRAWGRPILTSFHAIYSVGGFLGAAIGGVFAHFGFGPRATFISVGALVAVLALWSWAWLLRQPPVAPEVPAATAAGPQRTKSVFFLGVLAFCCLVGEGAAADWSTVYVRDNLGSSAGFAAAAYAAFSLAMVAGRLTGDALAARFGAVALVRASALLAASGLAIALAVPDPIAGVVGFGFLGAGLACIAPQVFSAAGNRDPARAGQALARVAGMGYAGFLVGPVVIGGVAQLSSLRWALIVPVVLTVFVAVTAAALRGRRLL